jgi:hypothetical protein
MDKQKIYIASPYTSGDKLQMVRLQIDAWHLLRDYGFIPIAPLLTHYMNEVRERSHAEWLEYDFEILKMCQGIIRIRPRDNFGIEIPSRGADMEQEEAVRLNIPFLEFISIEQLKYFLETTDRLRLQCSFWNPKLEQV